MNPLAREPPVQLALLSPAATVLYPLVPGAVVDCRTSYRVAPGRAVHSTLMVVAVADTQVAVTPVGTASAPACD